MLKLRSDNEDFEPPRLYMNIFQDDIIFFSSKEDFMNTFNLAQCMMIRLSMYTYCFSKSAFDFVMEHFLKENIAKLRNE